MRTGCKDDAKYQDNTVAETVWGVPGVPSGRPAGV